MSARRILIVDDFLPWQRFVAAIVGSEIDLKIVSVAVDGLEAAKKAKELQPDVILMDISLPVMNGIESTRQIRVLSPESKILFLSEHRDPSLIQATFEAGGSGYVLKCDSNADLIAGIRAVLLDQQFVSQTLKDWRKSFSTTD
jgi:two-component system, NarL family, nitrate/nitrite response regulator NarL